MYADPVDIDLGRHLAALDEDEGLQEWISCKQIEQEDIAKGILSHPKVWELDSADYALKTTNKVPFTAEEVLIEALDNSPVARAAYAELMTSPAAENLRQLLANYWVTEMWETRTHHEITTAIAAEKEALND